MSQQILPHKSITSTIATARPGFNIGSPLRRFYLRRTIKRTHAKFEQEYPECAEMWFDAHFVQKHVIPLVQQADQSGEALTLATVLTCWDRQFGEATAQLRPKRQQQILPIIAAFMTALDEILR